MGKITRITIHHSGEKRYVAPRTVRDVASRLRAYQSSHQQEWADIGYHFVIDPRGRIWEGRELKWQGAHAGNYEANRHNVGIAVLGNFQRGKLLRAQLRALESLARWLMSRYGIPGSQIYTHNEVRKLHGLGGTACPGKNFTPLVHQLRSGLQTKRLAY